MMCKKDGVILLVEDNKDDADLTKLAFQDSRIKNPLVHVNDGAEALDYLFRRGAYADRSANLDPQVILLDLKLPKVDGLDVLRELRANTATKRIPVVILTTSKQQEDLVSGYDRGANSYIQKPVDFSKFMEAIKQLSEYWLSLNVCPDPAGGQP